MRSRGPSSTPAARRAFTLIELLVVMSVIALMAVAIGFALTGGNDATRMRAGVATVSSYLQAARSQAILHRQPVRVLVRDEPSDRGHHWRQLGAVRQEPAGNGSGGRWVALDDGVLLPEGVYFWPVTPAADGCVAGTMQLEFPLAQPVEAGRGASWRFFEIGPDGTLERPGEILLAPARWEPEGAAPVRRTEAGAQAQRLGVSRLGAILALDEAEALPTVATGGGGA